VKTWGKRPPSLLAEFPWVLRALVRCTFAHAIAVVVLTLADATGLPIGVHGDLFILATLVLLVGAAAFIGSISLLIASAVLFVRATSFRTRRNIRIVVVCASVTALTIAGIGLQIAFA
jgi:hypothetical protein